MNWSDEVDVRDDRFHQTDDDPYWNESSFISFHDVERNLLGLLYFYFRPNQKTVMAGPILFDHTGSEFSDCLYQAWDWHMPIPDGADMFDFSLPNGFAVKMLEPLRRYRHTYEGPHCSFDLTFEATTEPHYLRLHKGELNPGMADYVKQSQVPTGHYDQCGLMSGSLTIRGETVEVIDSPTLRDRTWGSRPIRSNVNRLRGGYTYGQAPNGDCFLTFCTSPYEVEHDPLEGTTENITGGFYQRDGKKGNIEIGTRRCTGRGPDGRPRGEIIDAVDEYGRELHAVGTVRSLIRWPHLWGNVLCFWCLQTFDFDGHVNVAGELQDYMTYEHSRRLQDRRAGRGVRSLR